MAGTSVISQNVQKLYERFPYPHYPLLAGLHWQDGYAASSLFAGRLYQEVTGYVPAIFRPMEMLFARKKTILVGGAGETLPYILRKMEPADHRLLCVDLSQASLRRARMRLWANFRTIDFVRDDLVNYLDLQGKVSGPFDHIDAYGVLHHMANPGDALSKMAAQIAPQGTMRLMVYNSHARFWIHQIQAAFRLLGLDPYQREDRSQARRLLKSLMLSTPALRGKLNQLGKAWQTKDARLVDTFFHCRETRIDVKAWFERIHAAGLVPYALFDRYGELDDLPNPLWKSPSLEQLLERLPDGRFENNLELYLCRESDFLKAEAPKAGAQTAKKGFVPWVAWLRPPPRQWFDFPETRDLPFRIRWRLWHAHLRYLKSGSKAAAHSLERVLSMSEMQRLARVGALFPGQLPTHGLKRKLFDRMTHQQRPPERSPAVALRGTPAAETVIEILQQRQLFTERRFQYIMQRLERAQEPKT